MLSGQLKWVLPHSWAVVKHDHSDGDWPAAASVCLLNGLTYLSCSVLLQASLNDLPSAPAVNGTSITSAPPSAIISQGRWHAPVEPFAVVALTTVLSLGRYRSLCKRRCDKCYNYVNSVQPKCFCRWNIANWTAFWQILSALTFCCDLRFKFHLICPSKPHLYIFSCVYSCHCICAFWKHNNPWRQGARGWLPQLRLALAWALLLLRGLKDLTGGRRSKLNRTRCVMRY